MVHYRPMLPSPMHPNMANKTFLLIDQPYGRQPREKNTAGITKLRFHLKDLKVEIDHEMFDELKLRLSSSNDKTSGTAQIFDLWEFWKPLIEMADNA